MRRMDDAPVEVQISGYSGRERSRSIRLQRHDIQIAEGRT